MLDKTSTMSKKPSLLPNSVNFSSGPCKKYPNWQLSILSSALVGRSHRSQDCVKKLHYANQKTRQLLSIPDDYGLVMVPASDTGAMEAAIWNLLGPRQVEVLLYESFSQEWFNDASSLLGEDLVKAIFWDRVADMDNLTLDGEKDFIFVINATTCGVAFSDLAFLPYSECRKGLVICDASAAAFSQDLAWQKLDVVTFSWQKALGAEALLGGLVLSPKAMDRLANYTPKWRVPKILRLKESGVVKNALFSGEVINTPSMLLVEDYIKALGWVESMGGLTGLKERIAKNNAVMCNYVAKSPWLEYRIAKKYRAQTVQILEIIDKRFSELKAEQKQDFFNKMLDLLAKENIAYDINCYRGEQLSFRIWSGPTIDAQDLAILCSWLDYSFYTVSEALL